MTLQERFAELEKSRTKKWYERRGFFVALYKFKRN